MTNRKDTFLAASSDKRIKLTAEEQTRWTHFLHQTWNAIGYDAEPVISRGRSRGAEIIEMCLDANRLTMFTDMTPEEEGVLCGLWIRKDRATLKWLRATLNY